MFSKEALKAVLKNDVIVVVFRKVNGEERTMHCTLKDEFIKGERKLLQENTRPENPDTLAVWDLDNDGWRSFRVNSVLTIGFPNQMGA